MNILILNWRDTQHPLSGGAEIALLEHAQYWKKKRAKVTWFTSSFSGAKKEEYVDGIRFVRRGSQFTVHIHAFFYILSHLKNSVDIIIDNFHFIPFFTPLYLPRKKIIALIHEPARQAWFKNINICIATIGYILEPLFFFLYQSIHFITGSHSIEKELEKYHIKKKLIYVIPHGIRISNHKKLYKKLKEPVLLYLGQLTKDKGIEDVLEMFEFVNKKIKTAKLWIVGKTTNKKYQERLQRRVKKSEYKKNITFFGYISEKVKNKLFQQSWILVHPSMREGWGLNVIEAASFGTPTIGYNVTGLQDSIQNGITGLLTNKNTSQDLSEKVIILIQNKKMYDKLSKNAVRFSENFDWSKAGHQSWELIKYVYEKANKKK